MNTMITTDAVTMPATAALTSLLPTSAVCSQPMSSVESTTAGSWRDRVRTSDVRFVDADTNVDVDMSVDVAPVSHHNSIAATAGLSGYAAAGAVKQAIAAKPAAPPRGEPR